VSALKIGELAGLFNVPVETIRYYEQAGLLPKPARTAGNYRLYSKADADNLAFVLNCRMLDMRGGNQSTPRAQSDAEQ
jgi:DNA-binding transcriptional MerR regulator